MTDSKNTSQGNTEDSLDILKNLEGENSENISKNEEKTENEPSINPLPWEEWAEEVASIDQTNESNLSTPTSSMWEWKELDDTITSLETLISRIQEKEYDYVLIEPEETKVKVTFRENNTNRNISYIKYPTYTNILLKLKQTAGLVVENTGNAQEGKWKISIWKQNFLILTKTAPWKNGERIWLKTKLSNKINASEKKKVPISTILWFFAAIFFVMLVLGWSFISFIVINAKTVDDVQFFASLWISLNDINTFISQVVNIIFSILLIILTIVLSVSLFKFFLTKKVFKRKKILYALLSVFFLSITFTTATAWMYVDAKIKQLPNWQEQAYWNLKIFDNALLVSPDFSETQALLTETQNLIWPITLNFDLTNFQNEQQRNGLTITKYLWNFGGTQVETFTPIVIQSFKTKWNYEIRVEATGTDRNGKEVTQALTNLPALSLSHVIDYTETVTNNWWKKVSFDASSLENIGSVEWYFKSSKWENTSEYADWTRIDGGYRFIPGKIFFETMYIGLGVLRNGASEGIIEKVFVVQAETNSEMSGKIAYEPSLTNELEYNFTIENPKTSYSNWFIEKYDWKIGDRTYALKANLDNPEIAPSIKHTFQKFWEQEISVTLTDSLWEILTLNSTLTLQKNIELSSYLNITDNLTGQEPNNFKYEVRTHEYFIDELWVPSTLKFDARYVRPSNISYTLDSVEWDEWNDGDVEAVGKNYNFDITTEWNKTLAVTYSFKHRRNADDVIQLKELVYVQAIKKDAILVLDIENESNYAPVTVRFDASKSYIKNDNIIKFVYDYGDGITEERDAINPGHRYSKAGDYVIKLTAIWESGKSFTIEKKLSLLPAPQDVKISPSLKKAPINQGIDFSSADSAGQIIEYFWDFGDGNISTEANPSHAYKKAGFYTVKLQADFINSNSITDEIQIEIYE